MVGILAINRSAEISRCSGIMDVHVFMIKRGQSTNDAYHNSHRMCVAPKTTEKSFQCFMQQGVVGNVINEFVKFLSIG